MGRLLASILSGQAVHAPSLPRAHANHTEPARMAHEHDDHAEHEHGLAATRGMGRRSRRRLLVAIAIGLAVMAAEVIGGLVSGSLVILSDAAHVLTDVSALALASLAVAWAARPATTAKSYGFHRAEIVAAFVNALALWVLAGYFVYEAVRRLAAPPDVDGVVLTGVALAGLAANLVMAAILHRGAERSINLRSAYVHVMSDVLGSVAAVVTGVGIQIAGWTWLDPATTLLVSALIIVWTFNLTRQTLHILLEGTPERMDVRELRGDVLAVDGVTDVHDLHVWTLTTGVDTMSAHIRVADPARGPDVVKEVRRRIQPKYGLGHLTLEVEAPDARCDSCD